MTEYVNKALFVPAPLCTTVRGLCEAQAGFDATDRMFRTGIVPKGSAPGTEPIWYVTDGPMDADLEPLLTDPEKLQKKCEEKGVEISLAQCQHILSSCIIGPGGTAWGIMADNDWELAQDLPPT